MPYRKTIDEILAERELSQIEKRKIFRDIVEHIAERGFDINKPITLIVDVALYDFRLEQAGNER